MSTLSIGASTIHAHNGLFSLNDLHKAAGSEERHKPALFLRGDQTQSLIAEISKGTDSHLFLSTVKGRNGGTYACRELVIAYAAWISAEFHLKVIRVFLDAVGPVKTPYSVQPHQSLSAEDAAILRDLISSYAKTLPKEQQADFIIKAWSKLKAHFGVSYRQIPEHEFSEAVSIIGRHMAGYADPAITASKPLEVDRTKIEHIYTDLGRLSKFAADLQSRINGLGMRDEDLPPQWWQSKRLPLQLGA